MTFPSMGDEFSDWETSSIFKRKVTTIEDYEAKEESTDEEFSGILYPMSAQKIKMKPEGERAWKWMEIISSETLIVGDNIFTEDGKLYRIMGLIDWMGSAGTNVYELTETFDD